MSKKLVILTLSVSLIAGVLCFLTPWDSAKKVQAVLPSSLQAVTQLVMAPVPKTVAPVIEQKTLTEAEQLETQMTALGNELKTIDMAKEFNGPNVPTARRDEIVKKMNLYASLVHQYTQMELKKMEGEEKL